MTMPLTVCYFGTYRSEYSRNIILIKSLRTANINVIECHVELWHDIDDRVDAVKKGFINPALWKRMWKAYIQLLKIYRSIGEYDVMIIGYPGQFDVFLGRLLTWLRGKKLVWDVFMSIFLISVERGLAESNALSVKLIKLIEKIALKLPNKLIIDTQYYAAWFIGTYKTPFERFWLIPTGADDEVFFPMAQTKQSKIFHVLYYGTFIQNHGVPYIIHAASFLNNNPDICFSFIGAGPELKVCMNLAHELEVTNIKFLPWQDKGKLRYMISMADVVLGAFGNTPQSLMTIHNKIYEAIAMKKAVISGDSPAIRSAFTDTEEILLCDRGNPIKLANLILQLYHNPTIGDQIAKKGYQRYIQSYSIASIGQRMSEYLQLIMAQ